MLIGHKGADPLPKELWDVYLALAGLAGTAFERLHNELELKRHRDHLEELVKVRTDELVKANQELARSNQELEQFAYVASHDLQEPLRVAAGYVQLLAQEYQSKLSAEADEYIGYVVEGVKRMQQLIADLLRYSRVGSRGQPFADTDTEAVLARAVANLQTAVQENDALLTHDPLPTVRGDATQLMQLFQNLVGNGLKFRSDRRPQIHVSARRVGGQWEFSVRDNGIGIAPEYWEQIFIIFQRLHTRKKYPGTGIGLALCKKIVERHGGRIWLDSRPGEGTTFYFTI